MLKVSLPPSNVSMYLVDIFYGNGFPDNYIFFGTKDSVYQQIGNAVPPVLGRAVAEKVLEILGCREEYKKLRDIYEEMK